MREKTRLRNPNTQAWGILGGASHQGSLALARVELVRNLQCDQEVFTPLFRQDCLTGVFRRFLRKWRPGGYFISHVSPAAAEYLGTVI